MFKTLMLIVVIVTISVVMIPIIDRIARPSTALRSAPTIERIQQLAELVVLRISINDIQTTTLNGYVGGLDLVLIVHGEVTVACDLSKAKFVSVEQGQRRAVLSLPVPTLSKPRLDHSRTNVYQIGRRGMWCLLPGPAGERHIVNVAMEQAQGLLATSLKTNELIDKAKRHANDVLVGFFKSMDWTVEIRWLGR